jgi:hypothetical protein
MSADSYTSIYHLTKHGWVDGPAGCYLSAEQAAAILPPVGKLLTLRYLEFTPYIKTSYTCIVDYITPDRYVDLLRAVVTYGVYPPAMKKEAEKYGHDEQLAKLFAGPFARHKVEMV